MSCWDALRTLPSGVCTSSFALFCGILARDRARSRHTHPEGCLKRLHSRAPCGLFLQGSSLGFRSVFTKVSNKIDTPRAPEYSKGLTLSLTKRALRAYLRADPKSHGRPRPRQRPGGWPVGADHAKAPA